MNDVDGRTILIDDHGSRVSPAVWELYERALGARRPAADPGRVGHKLPPLEVLLDEARRQTPGSGAR